MNEIILNYIVQAILGGASGYITNDYAINMLFKEYTPLKIGGVIKKTRTKFIENLSSMVENDIINKEKLQEILSDESFKAEFENLTADFYENCLYEAAGFDTFADIDGFESTIKSTDIFAAKIINEQMPTLYNLMAENLDLNNFLSNVQLNNISDSIYYFIIDIFNCTDIVQKMLLSVYKDNNTLVLNDILDKSNYEAIISNVIDILTKAASESNTSDIDEIIFFSGFKSALHSSKEILSKRKIKEVINLDSDVLKDINTSILAYINSEKGTHQINSITNSWISYGKKCNKTVFQLLDSTFEENLKQYLIKNIPSVTENVVNWINENSNLIDQLIEESIDEVIEEADGLKAKLLSTIKNTYFSSLSKKYSIVDKIISYVEKNADPEKLGQNISAKLIDILNNLTVSEIVLEAEKNNISSEKVGQFLINYINNNYEILIRKLINYISEIELSRILPAELINEQLITNAINKLKELAALDATKNYLSNKSTECAHSFLTKELRQLIDEEKEELLVLKTKDFIKEKLSTNEDSIKIWIKKQISTSLNSFSSKELSANITNQLNNEIYKKYNDLTEELKNVQITTTLDKLNSIESLAKNSSESLRSYAVNNTDVILSGSIKAIVTDNLNKLDDNELVSLANDFIGRELKPIMYFGGVLGVAAGLILAVFQSSPIYPAKINIANMIVYAFVGFITNVFAINMIFKPYKEKKLLSKIPFLRNFSLGYIVKNQKTFAKNTAHFIGNSLLNKNSINELFDKYKDKIKNSFTESAADNDYRILSNLLADNKHCVVKSVVSYLKNVVSCNIGKLCNLLCSKLNNIKVASLMNENLLDNMSSLLTVKLQNTNISETMYSLISSDNSLESKVSDKVFKNYISSIQNNYFDKLNNVLANENEIYNYMLKNEDKFKSFTNKHINEIINSEKKEFLAKLTAKKISNAFLMKDSRDKITNKALNLINMSIDRNKTFEEIFDGKLKKYIDSNIPYILENISKAIKENIKENKNKITVITQSEIKSNLGFIEKGMYSLMGGDEIIDELLTKIITVKIPKFMDYKKQELNNIVSNALEEKFYKTKVEILYTGLNKLQLNELVDNYLNMENSIKVETKINNLTNELFLKAGSLSLNSILTLINANDLNTFLNAYSSEINAFTKELSANLKDNRNQIIKKTTKYTNSLIDEFMKAKFKDVFSGISNDNIKFLIDKTISELNRNDMQNTIRSALESCKDFARDINVGDFIHYDEFVKSAEHYFMTLLDKQEFEKVVKEYFEITIDEAVSVNFNFVDNEFKKYALNMFTDSCINSLRRNLDKILKSVEFDKIAQEEIENMEPEKIHKMFNSFGEKYFRRLMLYGFGGFVFGINLYVGFTLTILKIISDFFDNKS